MAKPNYVRPLDDMLVRPAYQLGVREQWLYECHGFRLKADIEQLRILCEKYLVEPFGGSPPVRFSLPDQVRAALATKQGWDWLYLVFNRYSKCTSIEEPERGWMAYTEVLIGFRVRKDLKGKPTTYPWFMPFIYIDGDSDRARHRRGLADPAVAPILIGRELYGLPKNPGYIEYTGNAQSAKAALRVLRGSKDRRIVPTPAIKVKFDPTKDDRMDGAADFGDEVPGNHLVGLKQLPDPENPKKACYQAVVETSLTTQGAGGTTKELGGRHRVTFEDIGKKLDFVKIFGIKKDGKHGVVKPLKGRSVRVRRENCYTWRTTLRFGKKVSVWPTR